MSHDIREYSCCVRAVFNLSTPSALTLSYSYLDTDIDIAIDTDTDTDIFLDVRDVDTGRSTRTHQNVYSLVASPLPSHSPRPIHRPASSSAPHPHPHTHSHRIMGLFSRKKKATPSLAASPVLPSPPSPIVGISMAVADAPLRPVVRLRVAVDPLPVHAQGADSFCVDIELDEDMQGLRRAVQRKLGGMGMGLFKVGLGLGLGADVYLHTRVRPLARRGGARRGGKAMGMAMARSIAASVPLALTLQTSIPIHALEQSREYTSRYAARVDLITLFPTFPLNQPSQLPSSLGPAGYQLPIPACPLVRDWFPGSVDSHTTISILVRPAAPLSLPAHITPLTLLAHYAPVDASSASRSSRPSTASSPTSSAKPSRRPPAVIDVSPHATVDDLKRLALAADGRDVASARLDKVVLWKVDMSESEMVVIEERGGLKGGQMPWPYPPTAEVPVKLEQGTDSVDRFWTASNARMVAVSVWISRSASTSVSTPAAAPTAVEDVPVFTYPMVFPTEQRRASASHSLPNRSPTPDVPVIVAANTLPSSSRTSRRGRPSTAPAVIDPSCTSMSGGAGARAGGVHAFGTRRARSPLAPRDSAAREHGQGQGQGHGGVKGLGIGAPDEVDIDMSRLRLNVTLAPEATEDGKVIWYQPGGGRTPLKRAETMGIRSLSHNKALRPYEVV